MPTFSPFGHADGAREDFANLVKFEDDRQWGGLATDPADDTARVLIGRKGSGKTYFVRRVRDAALRGASANFVTTIVETPPTTELVMDFARRWQSDSFTITKWERLWSVAILLSVLSHAARTRQLSQRLTESEVMQLEGEFGSYFASSLNRACDPCEQVQHLLLWPRRELEQLLQNPAILGDLKDRVERVLHNAPPAYFFLDGMDNHFDLAPHEWLLCQRGLLRSVVTDILLSQLGSRLHVKVALRDIVWADAKASNEQAVRITDDTYVRVLEWNTKAADYFLTRKVAGLSDTWFKNLPDNGRKSVAAWIGLESIENPRFHIDEPIIGYLLRHTRLLPRDIVVLGNQLCSTLAAVDRNDVAELQTSVREAVSYCAKKFGTEQIHVCAAELVSHMVPMSKRSEGYSAYLDNPGLTDAVSEQIQGFLRSRVSGIRLTSDELAAFLAEWKSFTSREYKLDSLDLQALLWRNRLLGYRSRRKQDVFFSDREIGSKMPPAEHYALHPILTDALDIRANGDEPVVPYTI